MPISGRVDFNNQALAGMDLAAVSAILKCAIKTVPYITMRPLRRYPQTTVFFDVKSSVTMMTSIKGNINERKLALLKTKDPVLTASGTKKG